MTLPQIEDAISRIKQALAKANYTVALMQLESLAAATDASWSSRRDISKLKDNYNLLKQYALEGFSDPSRDRMLEELKIEIVRQAELAKRTVLAQTSTTSYFTTLRTLASSGKTIGGVAEKYEHELSLFSLSKFDYNPQSRDRVDEMRQRLSELEMDLFDLIWITHPLGSENTQIIERLLASETISTATKRMIIGALMLGALEYFSSRRLHLLAFAAKLDDRTTAVRALTALLLVLWRWRNEKTTVNPEIMLLLDNEESGAALRQIFKQLINTRETERLTRKLNEEILPQMMKLRPEMEKLNEMMSLTDEPDIEANPEWEKIIKESGIEDRLKELSELQEEGADLMMGSMSHLKSFPFFHYVANWFRDFDTENDEMNRAADGFGRLMEMIDNSAFMCDSDKYSIALSLGRMPRQMTDMMMQQLEGANINFAEAASKKSDEEQVIINFVRDIYRFYNLFRRKGDFYNPFSKPINLLELPELRKVLGDSDTLATVGEFYFTKGYWQDALEVYSMLDDDQLMFTESVLQKVGYCKEKSGDLNGALESYEKAELLNGRNSWTLKRIAHLLKLSGRHNEALKYYNRLLENDPDNKSLLLLQGHSLLSMGDYKGALNAYFKIEFIDPETTKTLRPLAWTLFMTGDYKRSRNYYERIMAQTPSATDFLNYGHLEMTEGNYRKAVERYKLSLEAMNRDINKFFGALNADRKLLEERGVDSNIIDIVADEVHNLLWT